MSTSFLVASVADTTQGMPQLAAHDEGVGVRRADVDAVVVVNASTSVVELVTVG